MIYFIGIFIVIFVIVILLSVLLFILLLFLCYILLLFLLPCSLSLLFYCQFYCSFLLFLFLCYILLLLLVLLLLRSTERSQVSLQGALALRLRRRPAGLTGRVPQQASARPGWLRLVWTGLNLGVSGSYSFLWLVLALE